MAKNNKNTCERVCPALLECEEYELNNLSDTGYQSLGSFRHNDDHGYMRLGNKSRADAEHSTSTADCRYTLKTGQSSEKAELSASAIDGGYIPMTGQSSKEAMPSASSIDGGYIPMTGQSSKKAEFSDSVVDGGYIPMTGQSSKKAELSASVVDGGYIPMTGQSSKKAELSASVVDGGYIPMTGQSSKKAELSASVVDGGYIPMTGQFSNEAKSAETNRQIGLKTSDSGDHKYLTLIGEPSGQAENRLSADICISEFTEIEEKNYSLITAEIDPPGLVKKSQNPESDENHYDFITIADELCFKERPSVKAGTDRNDNASIKNGERSKCKIRRLHVVVLLAVLIVIAGGAVGLRYFLGSEPEVTIFPNIYSVTIGKTVTLQCSVSSNQAITSVTWRRNYGEAFSDITSTTNPDKYSGSTVTIPSLTIADVDNTDTGSYICFATNSKGTGKSNLGSLFVREPVPKVTISPTDYSVIKGQSTTIHCHVSSYGTVTSVLWKKNTLPITSTDPNKYIGSTPRIPSLTIDNVDTNDAGNYTCVATNNVGTGSSNVGSLNLITEPTVSVFPSYYSVSGGQPVTIQCSVSSIVPITSVSWQKMDDDSATNIDLTTNPHKYNGSTITSPSLTIASAEPEDAGNYTCSATNSVGTGSSNTGTLSVTGTKPTVTIFPTRQSVIWGQNVTIQCSIASEVTITSVSWQKDVGNETFNISAISDSNNYSGRTVTTPSLTIVDVKFSDAGSYVCFATNGFGTGSSNSGTLSVRGAVPNVTIAPITYSVPVEENVTIQCNISSELTIFSVSWRKYFGNVTSTIMSKTNPNKYIGSTVTTPSLTIVDADPNDAGSYICFATNGLGIGSSNSGNLSVTGTVPNVTISPITYMTYSVSVDQNVTIVCRVSSNLTVKSVAWKKYFGNATTTITSMTNPSKYIGSTVATPSLTIADADPNDAGSYICFATNGFGTGSSNTATLSVTGTVPTVNISPSAYLVTAGQSVTIKCSVFSNSTIKSVTWTKYVGNEDATITSKTDTYKYIGSTVNTPSLTIFNVIPVDAGDYTCSVTNSYGTGSSNTGALSVTGSGKFEFAIIVPRISYTRTLKLLIYSSQNGSLQVKGTAMNLLNQNKTLEKGKNEINLPKDVYLDDGKQDDKTVRIISSVPVEVFVIIIESHLASLDIFLKHYNGFYVIPKRHLSTQYIVPSFRVHSSNDESFFGVVALDTATEVNITVCATKGNVSINGMNYNDGDVLKLSLASYESLQVSHNYDLSGTTITSSAPIAVMAGNRYGQYKKSNEYENSFIENILPVDQQDTEFIVPSIQDRPESVVRVYSYYRNNVTIYSDKMSVRKEIEPGKWHQFRHENVSYIKTASNVLVMIFPKEVNQVFILTMKQFMMTIPGRNQYKSEYFFVVPDLGMSYLSFSLDGNDTNGFEMDGKPLNVTGVTTKTFDDEIISSFTHIVNPGAHRVINTEKHVFGLWVNVCTYNDFSFSLWKALDCYGFPVGIRFH